VNTRSATDYDSLTVLPSYLRSIRAGGDMVAHVGRLVPSLGGRRAATPMMLSARLLRSVVGDERSDSELNAVMVKAVFYCGVVV
jgi:hypothetical protein